MAEYIGVMRPLHSQETQWCIGPWDQVSFPGNSPERQGALVHEVTWDLQLFRSAAPCRSVSLSVRMKQAWDARGTPGWQEGEEPEAGVSRPILGNATHQHCLPFVART